MYQVRVARSFHPPGLGGHQAPFSVTKHHQVIKTCLYEVKKKSRANKKNENEKENHNETKNMVYLQTKNMAYLPMWSNSRGRTLRSGRASLKYPSVVIHLTQS